MRKHLNEANADDDGFETQGETFPTKCPITMTEFVDPVYNKTCKHSFCKKAIVDMIQRSNLSHVACPMVGCRSQVSIPDLIKNTRLEEHVEKMKRQNKGRKEKDAVDVDEDDDDIDLS